VLRCSFTAGRILNLHAALGTPAASSSSNPDHSIAAFLVPPHHPRRWSLGGWSGKLQSSAPDALRLLAPATGNKPFKLTTICLVSPCTFRISVPAAVLSEASRSCTDQRGLVLVSCRARRTSTSLQQRCKTAKGFGQRCDSSRSRRVGACRTRRLDRPVWDMGSEIATNGVKADALVGSQQTSTESSQSRGCACTRLHNARGPSAEQEDVEERDGVAMVDEGALWFYSRGGSPEQGASLPAGSASAHPLRNLVCHLL
jgi:hypothetical protein